MAGKRGGPDLERRYAARSERAGCTIGFFGNAGAVRPPGGETGIGTDGNLGRIRAVECRLGNASNAPDSAFARTAATCTADAVPAEPAAALRRLRGVPQSDSITDARSTIG